MLAVLSIRARKRNTNMDRRRGGTSTSGIFIDTNPAIAARYAGEANQRANRANEAYVDSTNLSTATRRDEMLRAQQAQAAQAEALKGYYGQPAESRGRIGDYMAPRLADIDPSQSMALTQSKEQREIDDFGTFIDQAKTNPQAALAFARSRSIDVPPQLQEMIGNTYFAQQLDNAFKTNKAIYGNRPDLMQKAMLKATTQIMGNLSAAQAAGRAIPSGPMGYDPASMPTAPAPPPPGTGTGAASTKAPRLTSIYDETTGREVKVQWDPEQREWVPVGGPKAATTRETDAVTTADRLKHRSQLEELAVEVTKRERPDLWRETYEGIRYEAEFPKEAEKTLQRLTAEFPPPGAGPAPTPTAAPSPAPAPAPAPVAPAVPGTDAPYQGETPPPGFPNATRYSDGAWYVKQNGQSFKVVE